MRIDRLDLIAYGCFTGKTLDFSAGKPGLHLIHGENEAGKSTSLRALIALLFGIEARTSDSFLHDNPKLRLGGRLCNASGKELEFVRRKGNKNVLLVPGSEEPLPDEALAPFLPGLDREVFCRVHGIDHDRLVQGGRDILDQTGDIGQALLTAAMGVVGLKATRDELRQRAGELFSPRASTRPVNQAIKDFREIRKRLKEETLQVSEWKKLQGEVESIETQLASIEGELGEIGTRLSRCRRGKRLQGPLAARQTVLEKLATLEDVPRLEADFGDQCRRTQEAQRETRSRLDGLEAKLARKQEEATSTVSGGRLLENEEAIEALYRQLGAVEKAIEDLPVQDAKHRTLKNQARTILAGVRPGLGLEECLELRPALLLRRRVDSLATSRSVLDQRTRDQERARRDLEEQLTNLKEEAARLEDDEKGLDALRLATEEARQSGKLDERLAEVRTRQERERATLDLERQRLGRFPGDLEVLMGLALPVDESLDRFERDFAALEDRAREHVRRLREVESEQAEASASLEKLLASGEVLTIDDLHSSRDQRDQGWQLIRRSFVAGEEIPDQVREFAGDEELPEVYEACVTKADHVADRLRETSDRVLERSQLEVRMKTLQKAYEKLSDEEPRRKVELEQALTEWEKLWEGTDIHVGTPREMKDWLQRVDALRSRYERFVEARVELDRLEAREQELVAALRDALTGLGGAAPDASLTSSPLLHLSETRIAEHERRAERMRQLDRQITEDTASLEKLEKERKQLDEEQAQWLADWTQALAGLGLEPATHPDTAIEVFEKFQGLFDVLDEADGLDKRKWGIAQVPKRFEEEVLEFVDRIGFDPGGRPATELASAIHHALKQERSVATRRERLLAEIHELEGEVEDTRLLLKTHEDRLQVLCGLAGVKESGELVHVAERAESQRQLEASLAALDQEIARGGDGLAIEQLEAEAGEIEPDAVEARITELERDETEHKFQRDELRDRRQVLKTELARKEAGGGAAQASEEKEQLLAEVVSGAREYLRLETAARILDKLIEDYRQTNQAPVLRRAGELFSRLTLGSFAELRDEVDDSGRPVLLGVRPDHDEVYVEGMSEGTRDQLYLALRLATLEGNLEQGEPMPFVVDDILVSFDDRRTRAGLEVLAELGQRTQVLLFTHHSRVVELAEKVDSPAGVIVHELERVSG